MTETAEFKEWLKTQEPDPSTGMFGHMGWKLHKQEQYKKKFGKSAEEPEPIYEQREKMPFSAWARTIGE